MTTKEHLSLPITGLDCVDCARTLEGGVAQLEGVESSVLDFASATLSVEYDEQVVQPPIIITRVRALGYDVASEEYTFEVAGMDCADCARKLEQAVGSLPNVIRAQVVFATAQLNVQGVDDGSLRGAVISRAAEVGYDAKIDTGAEQTTVEPSRNWQQLLYRRTRVLLTAVSGLSLGMAVLMHRLGHPQAVIAAYLLALVAGGFHVARTGWATLRTTRSLDMNTLMTIAAIGAVAIGEWAEGATAMFLFSLGNTLESWTMDRARQAIRKLIELSPREATRVRGEETERVAVSRLAVGDLIVVKPGEKMPMDGSIEQGESPLNQAPITGESSLVDVQPGSSVYAGSINGHGALFVRVTKLAEDNTLARIVRMVQEAQSRRSPSERFVDTFAKYYTPAVLVSAVVITIAPPLLSWGSWSEWFYRALVLLVISCPCALVISTPVAIVSAISNAARHGILIKGGQYLEDIGRVRAIAFDKTGTLTKGLPTVTDVEPTLPNPHIAERAIPNLSPDQLLALAASIEATSGHPIARAIVSKAREHELAFDLAADSRDLVGHGAQVLLNGETHYAGSHRLFCDRVPHDEAVCQRVAELEAEGKTTVLVGSELDVLGIITVSDQIRDESAAVIRALRSQGIQRIVLLSGDNERTTTAIAQAAGIHDVRANLMPEDKVGAVESLLSEHGTVAMVGDGVNDAPALARATVGIAMGAAGTDAALETADIVLMSDDLRRIPDVIHLGRRTLGTIKQNVGLSLLIKGIFLLLAVAGHATLWMAVFADVGTSLIVTLNGMRLLREGSLDAGEQGTRSTGHHVHDCPI